MMSDLDQNKEEYNYDAWGEHMETSSLPTVTNKIRYAGSRVECFVDTNYELEAVYETGIRHYWAKYGRFLQRDPLSIRKPADPRNPIRMNPYVYADNNPVMMRDASGMIPTGYYRGARMGDKVYFIGRTYPDSNMIYDCCGGSNGEDRWNIVTDDMLDKYDFYSQRRRERKRYGRVNLAEWHEVEGYVWSKDLTDAEQAAGKKSVCDINYGIEQPNSDCVDYTYAHPDVLCTLLSMCVPGADCAELKYDQPVCPFGDGYQKNDAPFEGGFPSKKWVSSVNFNPINWKDPLWQALYTEMGDEIFTQFVNEIIPWYEEIYWEADYDKGFLKYHCGEFADLFYSNRALLPEGWKAEIATGPLGMHKWTNLYHVNYPGYKFALDPQGASMKSMLPVFHLGIISHQPDIWELWTSLLDKYE